jgi:DNA adenine methylase
MIVRMRYPGGKGKTFQHIINLMPPHEVYIETHLGGGSVMSNKAPAKTSIGIDIDERALNQFESNNRHDVRLVHSRAEDYLRNYSFNGCELIYADPPYLPETRRKQRIYRHEYDTEDHERLLDILVNAPCKVMISGYSSGMYERKLKDWTKHSFPSKTHRGVALETVWFNFEAPNVLHDPRYLGSTFRERDNIKRRLKNLQCRIERMDSRERSVFAKWFEQRYMTS